MGIKIKRSKNWNLVICNRFMDGKFHFYELKLYRRGVKDIQKSDGRNFIVFLDF
jgi:hypothetical protein